MCLRHAPNKNVPMKTDATWIRIDAMDVMIVAMDMMNKDAVSIQ